METTRRLSITLLLVTPLISARELSSEERESSEAQDLSGAVEEQMDWRASTEVYKDTGSWLRQRRSLDSPGEDMETAEQVLFRPIFRHRQMIKEREERQRVREELRRQFSQNTAVSGPAALSGPAFPLGSPSVKKNYYNTYPGQNQRIYSPQVPQNQRIYSPQVPQNQRVYSPQVPQNQMVYSPQVPQNQRVYSPQIPEPQRGFPPINPQASVPNEGFRPHTTRVFQ